MINHVEMADLISRHGPDYGVRPTPLARVSLVRSSTPTLPMPTVYEPSVCLVASGRKRIDLGATSYHYGPGHVLAVSVDLPVTGTVVEASPERPFLCVRLDIDRAALGELMLTHVPSEPTGPDLVLAAAAPDLVDAVVRLLRLLDTPADTRVLAPLVEREILYRLLTGASATSMRRMIAVGSRTSGVVRAIAWLRQHFRAVFTVEALAQDAGMSASAFHQQFKAVTGWSPLQYRNALRLEEARRLMVTDAYAAASAGFAVGYQSASQFNRDYSRAFGISPLKNARMLRNAPDAMTALTV